MSKKIVLKNWVNPNNIIFLFFCPGIDIMNTVLYTLVVLHDFTSQTNSFQVVLLTDGMQSYSILNYGDMNMEPSKLSQVRTEAETIPVASHLTNKQNISTYMYYRNKILESTASTCFIGVLSQEPGA